MLYEKIKGRDVLIVGIIGLALGILIGLSISWGNVIAVTNGTIPYPTYDVIKESLIETGNCSEFEADTLIGWIDVAATSYRSDYDVYISAHSNGDDSEPLRWNIDLYTPYDEISIGLYYNTHTNTWTTFKLVWPNRSLLDQWVAAAAAGTVMGRA